MAKSTTFQSIIMNLQSFWSEHGCLIWQPYYTQVGAGTMNPATFLRVLGPEPWNVAYVEPSVRPDDGRYGENPNRLQQHYQFQVILKPDPGNPQELYLQSLQAIGIDPAKHDIRFVEDNWESPALGAWGLGWEVWLDGQEITQFTYFQQAGGQVLEPVSVEITYGLDRIAMALQNVRNFKDIRWNDERTAGDVNLMAEYEHSKYYFELADVDRLRQMYSLFEAEADAALAAGLVLPAHDYILKCSHTFNILDTRGAIGVTERQAFFGRMRDLARKTADMYATQRQTLEYPWLSKDPEVKPVQSRAESQNHPISSPQTLLFEIGTEELPVNDLDTAIAQLENLVPGILADARLSHGKISVLGTPRRLVTIIEAVQPAQADREVVVKGPPANRAYDASGKLTPAGEGFARSKGIDPAQLSIHEIDGGQYAAAVIKESGKTAIEIFSVELPRLISRIKFDKTMRWNASKVAFSRPIRWIMALFGDQVIPFEYAGLFSDRITRGLRFKEPATRSVSSTAEYLQYLETEGIVLDHNLREETIRADVGKLMSTHAADVVIPQDLLDEVTNLVEAPTAIMGEFEQEHLKLPKEVLVSVMKKHQRYFPLQHNDRLLPHFITIRNGNQEYADIVADGNAQVIRARFADAAFFIREDQGKKLIDLLPRLDTLTFQIKLGSMLDKTRRIEKITADLTKALGYTSEAEAIQRTAALCKADLVTHMVIEMTSLQGQIGRFYALRDGEEKAVADGIFEHYLPRYTGDQMPKSKTGFVVGLADRLDSLAGLFTAGLAPTGTKDPFAQRRAALGLVLALIEWNRDVDLSDLLLQASHYLPLAENSANLSACAEFISGRLKSYLLDQGFRYDVVDAVMAVQANNPAGAYRSVTQLNEQVKSADWNLFLQAYARCVRITRDQKEQFVVSQDTLKEEIDRELLHAIESAEKQAPLKSVDDFIHLFQPVIPVINRFFDSVMVMDEDQTLRQNRLGMLQRVARLSAGLVDFSYLEGF